MLGNQLDSVLEVPGFQEENAAQLLLGLGVRSVGYDHLAIAVADGCSIPRPLKCFATQKMPPTAKLVIIRETPIQEGFAFAFGHAVPVGLIKESQTDEPHVVNLMLGGKLYFPPSNRSGTSKFDSTADWIRSWSLSISHARTSGPQEWPDRRILLWS